MPNPSVAHATIPAAWHEQLTRQLQPGEEVVAWFETDLNARMNFESGLAVLTSRRVLSVRRSLSDSIANPPDSDPSQLAWSLSDDMTLQSRDFASVGALELCTPDRRLAVWRYTSGRTAAAHRFAQQFAAQKAGHARTSVQTAICPSCGGAIDPETGECPQCAVQKAPPGTSSLLRLVKFARPRARMIALGLALTVAATTASLVPPYLTKPLMDDVLVPFSRGEPYESDLVYWILGGLAGAAVLAWLLDWARTFVLAWVSERISADMRNRTYRASAAAIARILRRQAHRRPDVARGQRYRPHLQFPFAAV